MKFKEKWGRSDEEATIQRIVEAAIREAPGGREGQLESLASQVQKIQEIVGVLALALPEEQQVFLANCLGWEKENG